MDTKENTSEYYLSATANFLAALGGGMVLSKGLNILENPVLKGGSLLAFFVGTVAGLLFLHIIPKTMGKALSRWFSIFGAASSLLLLWIFIEYANNNVLSNTAAIIFFSVMCVRFGFWFYSRILRASRVAGLQQKIAWVELGYFFGMVFGLTAWSLFETKNIIIAVLFCDVFFQFLAGCLDLYTTKDNNNNLFEKTSVLNKSLKNSQLTFNKKGYWQLAIVVVLLTVGTQVIIFSLAHRVNSTLASYLLAVYYLGVAAAAYFCRVFKIQIDWKFNQLTSKYVPTIFLHSKNKKEIQFFFPGLILVSLLSFMIIGVCQWGWGMVSTSTISFMSPEMLLLVLVITSAFIYEVFTLALLDRIGLDERNTNEKGYVLRTYGLMGVGAAVFLWILTYSNNFINFILLLTCCALLTIQSIKKKA